MDANEYQELAGRTDGTPDAKHRLLNAALGLVGEGGEVADEVWMAMDNRTAQIASCALAMAGENGQIADKIKKAIFHGHALDPGLILKHVVRWQEVASTLCELVHTADPQIGGNLFPNGLPDITKELGDAQWYIPQAATAIGVTLADVMEANIAKLRARYPDGFDPARSQERSEE